MSKVTVTKEQMEAIKDQRDHFEQHLHSVLRKLGDRNCKFVDKSEPINNMSVEQIALAWHEHVEISPDYVSFEEAIAACRNGKKIISYLDGHVYDTYQLSDIEEFEKSIEIYEIINGKWTIED